MIRMSLIGLLGLALVVLGCPPGDDDVAGDDDSGDDDSGDDDSGDDDTSDDDSGDDDSGDDDTTYDPCDQLGDLGIEYWAVDLDNTENQFDDAAAGLFAVAVANVEGTQTAHVEVALNDGPVGGPLALDIVDSADILPGEIHVFSLPRRDADGENVTDGVDDGTQTWLSSRAFRISSDVPVAAHQFNPLDQRWSNPRCWARTTWWRPTSRRGRWPARGRPTAATSPWSALQQGPRST